MHEIELVAIIIISFFFFKTSGDIIDVPVLM